MESSHDKPYNKDLKIKHLNNKTKSNNPQAITKAYMFSLERNEPRRVSSTNTRSTMLDRLV